MDQPGNISAWWALHLRKARGEVLSPEEQAVYDAEAARHDRETPPLNHDLEALKALREQVRKLPGENVDLRARLSVLESEIHVLEAALNDNTRKVLGMTG